MEKIPRIAGISAAVLAVSIAASVFTAQASLSDWFPWLPQVQEREERREQGQEREEGEEEERMQSALPGKDDGDSAGRVREAVREESLVIATVAEAGDAVVSVIVTKDLPVLERFYEERDSPFGDFDFFFPEFGNDSFFSPFEFRIPRYREKGTEKREVGGGTAFFVSGDGLLLTNKHVVADEEAEYTVLLNDGTKRSATVVARDPGNDIALLTVDGGGFTALAIADGEPKLGQTVIAIGNALGEFRNTVSRGVVSGLKRSIDAGAAFGGPVEHLESIIQTDAAINRGNSGGPLLDLRGRVIGMNTAVAAGAQNIGFAIPAADLRRAIGSYEEHGKIIRAFLGVRYMPVTGELKERKNLAYDYGVLIVRGEDPTDLAVVPGSPADRADLAENDIILEVDQVKLDGSVSLARLIQRKAPGEKVHLKVASGSVERDLVVELGEQE